MISTPALLFGFIPGLDRRDNRIELSWQVDRLPHRMGWDQPLFPYRYLRVAHGVDQAIARFCQRHGYHDLRRQLHRLGVPELCRLGPLDVADGGGPRLCGPGWTAGFVPPRSGTSTTTMMDQIAEAIEERRPGSLVAMEGDAAARRLRWICSPDRSSPSPPRHSARPRATIAGPLPASRPGRSPGSPGRGCRSAPLRRSSGCDSPGPGPRGRRGYPAGSCCAS